ncbi:hypothetical protein Ancab_008354 [Ancistrocladus abbreviatus]
MAEVVSKSHFFSPSICHHHRNLCSSSLKSFPPIRNRLGFPSFSSSLRSDFHGLRIVVDQNGGRTTPKWKNPQCPHAQMKLGIGKAHKWWSKGLQPNMKEIESAQGLVESLLNAGDELVVVDFFSPGCGGCKALHPKICQLAEMNPDVQFLQVNYEEHKSMCYSLNVHVLPFFRFYRGAEGRLCSFSCTNATIKKFKDALAKHTLPRCSLGPPKGLEEKELLALAANKDLSFTYVPKPVQPEPILLQAEAKPAAQKAAASPLDGKLLLPLTITNSSHQGSEEKSLVTAGT